MSDKEPLRLPPLTHDEMKRAFKEAIKEWMNERFIDVGRWTVSAFLVALLTALIYLTLTFNGWHQK